MRRTDLRAQRKAPITFSASKSNACENLSSLSRFDRNSGDFETRAAHQFGNADKCTRRIMVLEVRAIDGVEFVVQVKIGAINSHRYQIGHRQPGSVQGLLYRIQHEVNFCL